MDTRGEHRFSSRMKQNKKLKFTLSFASPEKKLLFYIYAVIVKQKKKKESSKYYSGYESREGKVRTRDGQKQRTLGRESDGESQGGPCSLRFLRRAVADRQRMCTGSHLAPVNQDQEENIALLASSGAESSRSHAESLRRASGAAVVLSAPGGASLGFMFGGPGWSS